MQNQLTHPQRLIDRDMGVAPPKTVPARNYRMTFPLVSARRIPPPRSRIGPSEMPKPPARRARTVCAVTLGCSGRRRKSPRFTGRCGIVVHSDLSAPLPSAAKHKGFGRSLVFGPVETGWSRPSRSGGAFRFALVEADSAAHQVRDGTASAEAIGSRPFVERVLDGGSHRDRQHPDRVVGDAGLWSTALGVASSFRHPYRITRT